MQNLFKVTNTALDKSKDYLHRRSPKMQMEPTIAGRRLRLRESMFLTEAQMKVNLDLLKSLEAHGTISVDWAPKADTAEEAKVLSDSKVFVEEAAPQMEAEKPVVLVDDVGLPGATTAIEELNLQVTPPAEPVTAEEPRAGDPPAPPAVEAPVAAPPVRPTAPVTPPMNQRGPQPKRR